MNQEEFTNSLYKGIGRPYVWMKSISSFPYQGALLHACCYNPVFDSDIEWSRADYYYGLIQLTDNPEWYEERILEALAAPVNEMDWTQLLDFAMLFLHEGRAHIREMIYEFYKSYGSKETIGAEKLIELDGLEGFLFAIQYCDQDLSWLPTTYLRTLEEQPGMQSINTTLSEMRKINPVLDDYLTRVFQHTEDKQKRDEESEAFHKRPFPVIKKELERSQSSRSGFRPILWGKHASDEDLLLVAQALLKETRAHVLKRFLMIFYRRPFPLGIEPLLPLVRHENTDVAHRAVHALSLFSSPIVRDLGFELLSLAHHRHRGLKLLEKNYQPGDEALFLSALEAETDENICHWMGHSLNDIFEKSPTPRAERIFLFLYENLACSNCRKGYVQRLIEIDKLPGWMREECMYDANEEVRKLVSEVG